jgi:hypothetical protein
VYALGHRPPSRPDTPDLRSHSKPVWAALKAHRIRQKLERMRVGSAWLDRGLVFTTEVGAPIDPSNLRRTVKSLCEDAGVEPVSPNEMGRHTAASLVNDTGMTRRDRGAARRQVVTHARGPLPQSSPRLVRPSRSARRSHLRQWLTANSRTGLMHKLLHLA